jgi:DNA mismatch endonuclease (patch repair protein)
MNLVRAHEQSGAPRGERPQLRVPKPLAPPGVSWASSPAVRASMLGNKSVDSKPELALRSALHGVGLRFRKNVRLEAGSTRVRADVVLVRSRIVVFVDGCFWHSCPKHRAVPRTNRRWWRQKLMANAQRDQRQRRTLRRSGWRVIRVWEHEAVTLGTSRVLKAVASVEARARDGQGPVPLLPPHHVGRGGAAAKLSRRPSSGRARTNQVSAPTADRSPSKAR